MKETEKLLSTLWIFYLFNAVYGDITELYSSRATYSQEFLLFGALLIEPAIVMVLLSRVLQPRACRLTNIIVGIVLTVVNVGTLFIGTLTLPSAFFASTLIATGVVIVAYAWKWRELPSPSVDKKSGPRNA
jgi:Family of unknown function (DUF6326)